MKLSRTWSSPEISRILTHLKFTGGPLNGLDCVKFALRQSHEWLLTLSRGIWPVIVCWDLERIKNNIPAQAGEWREYDTDFENLIVNTDITSEACFAVSVIPSRGHVLHSSLKLLQKKIYMVCLVGELQIFDYNP